MNKILIIFLVFSSIISAKIEVLDRIAFIVDDGVIMESQIKSAVSRKRSKTQGVGGKPTNVKTIVKKKLV